MKKTVATLSFLVSILNFCFAQPFTHADTLRGSNGPERDWWDVLRYDIAVQPNLNDKTINGDVNILFTSKITGDKIMQLDLQEPLVIDTVIFEREKLSFRKMGDNVWSVNFKNIEPDIYFDHKEGGKGVTAKQQSVIIYYHGKPKVAKNAPWDGGVVWATDKNKNPWISIACQGLGASVWYPCKDYQGDEPDYGASLTITVPNTLMAVANGKLTSTNKNNDSTSTYKWEVKNPINNYNIIPSIGKYVNFNEIYKGEKGNLTMNYWVLDYNLEKAKKQFTDAPKMMKAFEYWFGPYPFYEDGYKLVDAPYLGMEHQSGIAYGNGYQNGYSGNDLSNTGLGMKWDFIIIHESAHEWFGNNITSKDIADMWIHEAFANYAETLFNDYYYGKQAGDQYLQGLRDKIENDAPIIGHYGVNKEGSVDMYYKGGNMIHTIRQVINNDEKFRMILRGMNKTFYHQTVTTNQVEQYINTTSGINFSKVFDQYLRTIKVPVLEYKMKGYKLSYHWVNCVPGFNLPLKIYFKGGRWIKPLEKWQTLNLYPEGDNKFSVDKNFYISLSKLN